MIKLNQKLTAITAMATVSLMPLQVMAQVPDITGNNVTNMQTEFMGSMPAGGSMMAIIIPAAVSLLGFIILTISLRASLSKLGKVMNAHMRKLEFREKSQTQHSKRILASAMAGELTENRNKCEAFLSIHNELLRNMQDEDKPAPYQESGDIIQQGPPLSRAVFESNLDRLDLLSENLAGRITEVYAAIPQNQDYITLERETPRPAASRNISQILENTQKILDPLDELISALNIIVRGQGPQDR